MEIKTITYTKLLGFYVLTFNQPMDKHMAEMKNEGWRVQSQTEKPGRRGFVNTPATFTVTYVKD